MTLNFHKSTRTTINGPKLRAYIHGAYKVSVCGKHMWSVTQQEKRPFIIHLYCFPCTLKRAISLYETSRETYSVYTQLYKNHLKTNSRFFFCTASSALYLRYGQQIDFAFS